MRVRISVLISGCLLAIFCASCGPRMRDQISIKPYKQIMPLMPAGTVPTTGRTTTLAVRQASLVTAPVRQTPVDLSNGRIYYGYYCLMCHGERGDGNGPVGESYVPKPADLTSSAITRLTDGQIYGGMLHGPGHDPVMEQTVLPDRRWPLVFYVRTFAKR